MGWTLNFEMFFYLLFGLAFLVRQRHHLLLVSAALLLVSEVLGRVGVLSHFYNNDIIYEFLLGIGLGVLHRRGLIRQGRWLPLVVLGWQAWPSITWMRHSGCCTGACQAR